MSVAIWTLAIILLLFGQRFCLLVIQMLSIHITNGDRLVKMKTTRDHFNACQLHCPTYGIFGCLFDRSSQQVVWRERASTSHCEVFSCMYMGFDIISIHHVIEDKVMENWSSPGLASYTACKASTLMYGAVSFPPALGKYSPYSAPSLSISLSTSFPDPVALFCSRENDRSWKGCLKKSDRVASSAEFLR